MRRIAYVAVVALVAGSACTSGPLEVRAASETPSPTPTPSPVAPPPSPTPTSDADGAIPPATEDLPALDQLLLLVERLADAERRAAHAEAEVQFLREQVARLEAEIRVLREQINRLRR